MARTKRRDDPGKRLMLATLKAAQRPFDGGAYEDARRLIEGTAPTRLVGDGLLFNLAERAKLTPKPEVSLTRREMEAGLHSGLYTRGSTDLDLVERLLIILSHASDVKGNDDECLKYLVAYALRLESYLTSEVKSNIVLLLRGLLLDAPIGNVPSSDGWRADAMNPFLVTTDHAWNLVNEWS